MMTRLVGKLIALIAVLLMPFGMATAATAAAHPAPHSMKMQHCPEQAPKHETKGAFAECTMACSAALPAADLPRGQPPLITCAPIQPRAAQVLHGLNPDTATPPPKAS